MREHDDAILREFAALVRAAYPEARIWAFGSRVRGDADPDSDLDVCVVVGDDREHAARTVQDAAWEVGYRHGLVVSALCYTESDFTLPPRQASPLVRHILGQGVVA